MQNSNPAPIRAIKQALKKAKKILVVSHKNPDGDAFGGALGMGRGLVKLGFDVDTAVHFENKTGLEWMGLKGIKQPATLKNPKKYDLIFCLDCGEWDRIGSGFVEILNPYLDRVINIDHHISNNHYGKISWVVPDSSCTSVLVADVLEGLGVTLDEKMLEPLYVGLMTDTSRFLNGCTRPVDFVYAAKWAKVLTAKKKGNLSRISRLIFENKPIEQLNTEGVVLHNLKTSKNGKVAWSHLTRADLDENGIEADLLHEISGLVRMVQGTKLSFIMIETTKNFVKLSFRSSNGFDTTKLAKEFDGGGHKAASGATIRNSNVAQAEKKVLAMIKKKAPQLLK